MAIVGWVALSDGLVDRNGKPIGTDFSSFYAAGSLALEGKAAYAYDMAAHYIREQRLFGADTPYYGWLYPPNFLLVAAPLALLAYPDALWQGVTLRSIWRRSPRSSRRRVGSMLRSPNCGYRWQPHSPRSSSISATDRTAF